MTVEKPGKVGQYPRLVLVFANDADAFDAQVRAQPEHPDTHDFVVGGRGQTFVLGRFSQGQTLVENGFDVQDEVAAVHGGPQCASRPERSIVVEPRPWGLQSASQAKALGSPPERRRLRMNAAAPV